MAIMIGCLLWLILLIVAWPIALLALIIYPIVWLLAIPFRIFGIAVDSALATLHALLLLPARVLRGPRG